MADSDDDTARLEQEAWERLQLVLPAEVRQKQAQVFAKGLDPPSWFLIILFDLEPHPTVRSFDTFEELVEAIKQLKPVDWAMPIYGWPVRYSVPDEQTGLKFLVHPAGYTVPLFTIPTEVQISSSFFLQGSAPDVDDEEAGDEGDDSELDAPPPTPAQRDAARSATAAIAGAAPEPDEGDESDEFADDEEDEEGEEEDAEDDGDDEDDEGVDDENPDSEDLVDDDSEHPGLS